MNGCDELIIVEAKIPKNLVSKDYEHEIGYGRTKKEARTAAGWIDQALPEESFRDVLVRNNPPPTDMVSEKIATELCGWIVKDMYIPPSSCYSNLIKPMQAHNYASAVSLYFELVWDRVVLELVEASIPESSMPENYCSPTGYGRDRDEARAHGGWGDPALPEERYELVYIQDKPPAYDTFSEKVARQVCEYHLTDTDTPQGVRLFLRELFYYYQYATAVRFCFSIIWDQGWDPEQVITFI